MPVDKFLQRKKDVLFKMDKSSKSHWDKKIIPLCKKINSLKNYYTTSSCSGRIVIMIDVDKKAEGLFLKVYHDLISFKQFKKDLQSIVSCFTFTFPPTHPKKSLTINKKKLTKEFCVHELSANNMTKSVLSQQFARLKAEPNHLIKFKQEPCILHVAARTLKDAKAFLRKAQLAGWKKSGIISSGNRFIVEMGGTDKLEFFIMDKGKILVDDDYLKLVVKRSNENLKKSWKKIEKLRKGV